jgi:hypothetical protein
MCPAVPSYFVSTLWSRFVEEVDAQADGEPGEETPPVEGGEQEHQHEAGAHAQDRDEEERR